jgi:hypothetical protein
MIPVAMAYAEMAGVPSQSLWLWARGQPPHRLLTEVTVVDFPLIGQCQQQGADGAHDSGFIGKDARRAAHTRGFW